MATLLETEEPEQAVANGTPPKSIQEFWDDPHFVRVLLGGRGSGKTFGVASDITAHLWQNAGGKAIVARETELSQADSSIDTFKIYFESLDSGLYRTDGPGFFRMWNDGRTIRVPSRLAIERMQSECRKMTKAEFVAWMDTTGDRLCGYIEFRGLPKAEKGKFRGMECSYLALVEADQIAENQFALSMACLRWKGSDPETCDEKGFIKDRCVVLDTNPPGTQHWIAKMEARELAKPEHDRTCRFWHIDTRENEHNLPENYIRDTILTPYADKPAMINRMLHGQYDDAFTGQPVYYAHSHSHEADELQWPRGALCIVSMDGATHNASVISSAKIDKGGHLHFWAQREIVLTGSDTDRQCVELLKVLATDFSWWNAGNDICPQTLFYCDPALRNSNYTKRGPTSSALKVIQSHGIFPGYKVALGLQPSIAAVNRLLQQHHYTSGDKPQAVWHFRISKKGCPTLCQALRGKYRYPDKGEPGEGSEVPLKGEYCDFVDDVADALRYGVNNVLDIAPEEYTGGWKSRREEVKWTEPNRSI